MFVKLNYELLELGGGLNLVCATCGQFCVNCKDWWYFISCSLRVLICLFQFPHTYLPGLPGVSEDRNLVIDMFGKVFIGNFREQFSVIGIRLCVCQCISEFLGMGTQTPHGRICMYMYLDLACAVLYAISHCTFCSLGFSTWLANVTPG